MSSGGRSRLYPPDQREQGIDLNYDFVRTVQSLSVYAVSHTVLFIVATVDLLGSKSVAEFVVTQTRRVRVLLRYSAVEISK